MTKLMARAFCAFNALAFFSVAAACGFVCWQASGAPALAAASVGGIALLYGAVNTSAAFLVSQLHARPRGVTAPEEKPAMTPGQLLANERWGKRRA